MPHQCVRCNKIYGDGDSAVLKGCSCGAKLFFYVKKDKIEKAQEAAKKLTAEDKQKIEKDVYEIIGDNPEADDPIILDFESISILEPGKFHIDLVKLFNRDKNALVYKLEDGKYMIDVASTMENFRKK